MKKLLYILLLCLISNSIIAQESNIRLLKAKDFKEKMDNLEDPIVLDCSSIEAFKEEHIEGAILIATSDMMNSILKDFSKETPLFVYCKYGLRSKEAVKKIKALGFKEIYQLRKGLTTWKRKGLPITKY